MVSKRKRRALKRYLIARTLRTLPKRKKYWVHPLLRCRNIDGEHLKLDRMMEFPDRFAKYTRMSPEVFQILLSMNSGMLFTSNRNLPTTSTSMPRFFVGDEAFPLSTRLMRPYPGKELSESQRVFNYRLSRARRCIENAFGIISARWRIFRRPIAAEPKQVENIVLACVALHNFVQKEGRGFQDELSSMQGDLQGECQNVGTPFTLDNQRALSVPAQDRASKKMRDDLCMYLMKEGAVDWQLSKINA